MEILFFGKKGDKYAEIAADYTKLIFPNTMFVWGKRGDRLPEDLNFWKGDYIFSYLSPWIIPKHLLNQAEKGSINWHPGPPEYPGIGCTNFAIYNQEKIFGITCHHMKAKVDTGNIIEVRRFNILEKDTVFSITQKCYSKILNSYYDILEKIYLNMELPISNENWKRKPYTRKELNALCEIKADMDLDEVKNRIKATKYDRHWAYIDLEGMKFYFKEE